MTHTIKNNVLTVSVSDEGSKLVSINDGTTEFLWQADPKYWDDRDLTIFPYIARMTNKTYTFGGKTYTMDIHGIAPYSTFHLKDILDTAMTLRLKDTPETFEHYPFNFIFDVTYALSGNSLTITYNVENTGTGDMYFAIGGHPGFNVPNDKSLDFSDYYLKFDEQSSPVRIGFSEACFVNGKDFPFTLKNNCIPLSHDLFDDDAIVLKNMAKSVTLTSDKSEKAITVEYPDMRYLGIWHMPKTDAPYVCIEPWSALPSRDGIVEDLAKQPDLIKLPAGKTYTNSWSITINNK